MLHLGLSLFCRGFRFGFDALFALPLFKQSSTSCYAFYNLTCIDILECVTWDFLEDSQ